ncbi:MAG: RcnB family protein [Panacagrimonas sp.]
MYKQLLLASTLSLGLISAPSAMAGNDDHQRGHDRGDAVGHRDGWQARRDDARDHDRGHERDRDHRWDGRRNDDHRWRYQREHRWHGPRYRAAPYHAPRGYSRHHWRAGERLPYGYRATRYVVHDYGHYHLYAPPRGHNWVRVDRDMILTVVATGVVAAVVYDLFA